MNSHREDSIGKPPRPHALEYGRLQERTVFQLLELVLEVAVRTLSVGLGHFCPSRCLQGSEKVRVLRRWVAQKLVDKPVEKHGNRSHEKEREGGSDDDTDGTWVRLRGAARKLVLVKVAAVLVAIELTVGLFTRGLVRLSLVAEVFVVTVDHLIDDGRHEQGPEDRSRKIEHPHKPCWCVALVHTERLASVVAASQGTDEVFCPRCSLVLQQAVRRREQQAVPEVHVQRWIQLRAQVSTTQRFLRLLSTQWR
mmetsp:Transcript_13636/g.50811  ORF Transcript_13636/g.50811 Transcript_13636/m.50811 type:complete len:252 (-) Transcript_13636:186-941(-)